MKFLKENKGALVVFLLFVLVLIVIAATMILIPRVTAINTKMEANIAQLSALSGTATKAASMPMPTSTVLPMATKTMAPTATLASMATTMPTEMPAGTPSGELTIGQWNISYFDGATDQMKSWTLKDLDPALWPVFPNVDNAGYPAADGVEYGMAESVFCQQDQTCDFIVAARHYRLFTGDYKIEGMGECYTKDGIGCAIAAFNVGDVTAFWASQKMYDGFTVTGRYWNGDKLPHAVWALLSNTVSNMLNLNSPLNQNGGANAGANCSVPGGCVGVDVTFVITSGNQVLVIGHTIVYK